MTRSTRLDSRIWSTVGALAGLALIAWSPLVAHADAALGFLGLIFAGGDIAHQVSAAVRAPGNAAPAPAPVVEAAVAVVRTDEPPVREG